jgi:ParB/RepB/Spo0J family partition protein
MSRIQSSSRDVQITVSLSKLTASRRNPRRVKPERDAHRRLVASIRAHGLLAPLVVQADESNPGNFRIIAGNRRLAALREAYKDAAKSPKVPCILRAVDEETADALALAENFVREPMHPLDEAEAFAKLAQDEAKRVESIAAEFGVSQPYVRLCVQPHKRTYEASLLMWPRASDGSVRLWPFAHPTRCYTAVFARDFLGTSAVRPTNAIALVRRYSQHKQLILSRLFAESSGPNRSDLSHDVRAICHPFQAFAATSPRPHAG